MAVQTVAMVQPQWALEVLNSYATDQNAQLKLSQLALQSPDDQGFSLDQGLIRHKTRI